MKNLVSFLLITYNQEDWVVEAVMNALNQDYENLEIIISDDCSTDRTWSYIINTCKNQQKNKKIILNRNYDNLGITKNVTRALNYATGDLIVMAAGDDVSCCNRVSSLVEHWIKNNYPSAIASSINVIDQDNRIIEDHDRMLRFNYHKPQMLKGIDAVEDHYIKSANIKALGAALAYSRDVFNEYGWDLGNCHSEDKLLLGRALLLNGCLLIPEKLVNHRITGKNVSTGLLNNKLTENKLKREKFQIFVKKVELMLVIKELKRKKELLGLQILDVKSWKNDAQDALLLKNKFINYATEKLLLIEIKIASINNLSFMNLSCGIKNLGLFRFIFEVLMLRCKICKNVARRLLKVT